MFLNGLRRCSWLLKYSENICTICFGDSCLWQDSNDWFKSLNKTWEELSHPKSETSWTCIHSNVQQGATPLVSQRSPIVWPYCSLDYYLSKHFCYEVMFSQVFFRTAWCSFCKWCSSLEWSRWYSRVCCRAWLPCDWHVATNAVSSSSSSISILLSSTLSSQYGHFWLQKTIIPKCNICKFSLNR